MTTLTIHTAIWSNNIYLHWTGNK